VRLTNDNASRCGDIRGIVTLIGINAHLSKDKVLHFSVLSPRNDFIGILEHAQSAV
jgi:hypothetical protein